MPIRTLIVDDEPVAREHLRELCGNDPELRVVGECTDGRQAIEKIRELAPELVFLDIRMRGVDGFGVIEAIGPAHMPFVVFTTAFDSYALQAFDADAVDYLLKPFNKSRFARAMTRIRSRMADHGPGWLEARLSRAIANVTTVENRAAADRLPARIVVEKGERLVFLDPGDIDCVEAQRNYVLVRARQEFYLLRASMKRVEEMLPAERFLRIHRSVIVNTARIRELERWFHGEYKVTMQNGLKFTSGRTYREKILGYIRNEPAGLP